jgi:PhnB protein
VQLYPHLTFDGRCEAAFQTYAKLLGGEIVFLMRYEDTPMDLKVPPGFGGKVSHATFAAGGFMLSGSDAPPERYESPQGAAMQLNLSDPADAERIFDALSEGGTVQTPLQETFWAARFGALVDRFGISWLINCGRESEKLTADG